MKHTVAALVEDRPGVLNRVASLFRRRGFNIDSLAVGSTEEDGISRMTFVVEGGENIVEQVEKQLYKLIDVVKVSDLTQEDSIMRELALIKVRCRPEQRREILDLVEIFRAQAVDVTQNGLVVQLVAHPDTVDGMLENLRPYGIREMSAPAASPSPAAPAPPPCTSKSPRRSPDSTRSLAGSQKAICLTSRSNIANHAYPESV